MKKLSDVIKKFDEFAGVEKYKNADEEYFFGSINNDPSPEEVKKFIKKSFKKLLDSCPVSNDFFVHRNDSKDVDFYQKLYA